MVAKYDEMVADQAEHEDAEIEADNDEFREKFGL